VSPPAHEAIVSSQLEDGIAAAASHVLSHFTIELPTAQLAAASVSLAGMGLI
jgi:hypothetical protein